jgi:hypothetical protein
MFLQWSREAGLKSRLHGFLHGFSHGFSRLAVLGAARMLEIRLSGFLCIPMLELPLFDAPISVWDQKPQFRRNWP